MRHSHLFSFFVLLLLLLVFVVVDVASSSHGVGVDSHSRLRLELFRRPSAPPVGSRAERLRAAARSDEARRRVIAAAIGRRRACEAPAPAPGPAAAAAAAPESAFAMPLSSGAYTGTGQYFVRFRVGTPAQSFVLVADTGSDLTWVKCRLPRPRPRPRPRSRSHPRPRPAPAPAPAGHSGVGVGVGGGGGGVRVFRPEKSSSWDPIRCSSEMCKTSLPFSLTACPTPTSPCAYDYGYSDGSSAQGVYASESATITLAGRGGERAKLRGLIVGCTSSSTGSSFRASDGVLGLGYSNVSFAARAAARFGGRFSYCLVDHLSPRNASSFLTFGPNPALSGPPPNSDSSPETPPPPPPRQTALLLEPRLQPFYAVSVSSVSVDGESLDIPDAVWDAAAGGGTILDSGTSLTVLAEPAYEAVASALSRRLENLPRVRVDPFEYCYNWNAAAAAAEAALPKLVVHFAGGARLEPPAKSYVIDVEDGVKCVGVASAPWPGPSIIGNILQQEHIWEFDLKNRRLRFKRSKCA